MATFDAPLLSFAVTARNDNFMGDFKWRLTTTCNLMARSLQAIGKFGLAEIVIADWNSEVPLHKELVLTPEAGSMVRFVVVPPALAAPLQQESVFFQQLASNVAVRRAWGTYIGLLNSDVLYTPATLFILFAILEGRLPGVPVDRAILTAGRRQLPVTKVQRQPSLLELEEYLNRNAGFIPQEPQGSGHAAPTELILMHRDLWYACGGTDERFRYWGWSDIDLVLRVTQRYPLVHLNHFGVCPVHMEHYPEGRNYDPKTFHRKINRPHDNPSFRANDDNWGLGNINLEWFRCENISPLADSGGHPPGTLEAWPITAARISADLGDPFYAKVVEEVTTALPGLLVESDINALKAVAWYSVGRRPSSFVEIGYRYPLAATIVARASPGVEIYGLVNWHRPGPDEYMFQNREDSCLTFLSNNALDQYARSWGYTRFVTGDPATAVSRLASSCLGKLQVELALVQAATAHAAKQAAELAAYLRPGGAMIITAPSAERFQHVYETVRKVFPQFTALTFDDGRNGIFLAAQLSG